MDMGKLANGQTRRQIMSWLKQVGQADSAALAQHLGLSGMAVRQHLYALQEDGCVTYVEEPRPLGRPAKLWQLTEKADRYFPETYAELSVSLLAALNQTFGAAGLERLLAARTRQQIEDYQAAIPAQGSLVAQVTALAAQRTREGYMAEVLPEAEGSLLLVEHHCPICVAARACVGLCQQELQVFQAVLGSQATIERTEHLVAGDRRCAYRVRGVGNTTSYNGAETDTPYGEPG
ncbi:MAG: transcriptional regulator [Synechococcales cyanobacterium]